VQRAVIIAFALMGPDHRADRLHADFLRGILDDDRGHPDGTGCHRRLRHRRTSLRGGRGSVAGVLFGALIMASLLNGLTLLAVSPELKQIARGGVLALAVWMDVRLGKV